MSGLGFAGWVDTVTENASKATASSTPTVIVNGTVVAGSDSAGIRQAVESAQR